MQIIKATSQWVKGKGWAVFGLLMVLLAVVSVVVSAMKAPDQTKVTVVPAAKTDLAVYVRADGVCEAAKRESIWAKNSDTVTEVLVQVGDSVSQGQPLLRLDRSKQMKKVELAETTLRVEEMKLQDARDGYKNSLREGQQEIEDAKTEVEKARKNLERYDQLYKQGAVTAKEWEDAQGELTKQESRLNSAREKVNNLKPPNEGSLALTRLELKQAREEISEGTVLAPYDGIILNLPVEKGGTVREGETLAVIGDLSQMDLKLEISEGDIGQIRPGQTGLASGTVLGEQKYPGTIIQVSPEAQSDPKGQAQRTFWLAKMRVNNGEKRINPGVQLKAQIAVQQVPQTLAVPVGAIVEKKPGEPEVFVLRDGRAVVCKIKTGISDDQFTQVLEGLAEGDQVINNPPRTLMDGEVVKVEGGK